MAAPRPRPQVMRLTDAAAERIKAVMAKAERPIGWWIVILSFFFVRRAAVLPQRFA